MASRKSKDREQLLLGIFLIALGLFVISPDAAEEEVVQDQPQQVQPQPQPRRPNPVRPQMPQRPTRPDWARIPEEVIQEATSRAVLISSPAGTGSGTKIGRGLVLTALHVVVHRGAIVWDIKSDGVPCTVSVYDQANDLVVLRLGGYDATEDLPMRYNPDLIRPNQPILIVGSPRGIRNVFQTGVVFSGVDYSGFFEVTGSRIEPGISGSLVYTTDGQVIGMAQLAYSGISTLGIVRNVHPIVSLLSTVR